MDPFELFGEYATTTLSGETMITTGPLVDELDTGAVLDNPLVSFGNHRLGSAAESRRLVELVKDSSGCRVADLMGVLEDQDAVRLRWTVAWLIKIGCLALQSVPEPLDPD